MKQQNHQLIALTHLSQLLDYITGFGGLIVPLVLWLTNKDKVMAMDQHGKAILNFQLSILIYTLISIPLILFFGLGLLCLVVIGLLALVFPIVNAVNSSNGKAPYYPLSIPVIR